MEISMEPKSVEKRDVNLFYKRKQKAILNFLFFLKTIKQYIESLKQPELDIFLDFLFIGGCSISMHKYVTF